MACYFLGHGPIRVAPSCLVTRCLQHFSDDSTFWDLPNASDNTRSHGGGFGEKPHDNLGGRTLDDSRCSNFFASPAQTWHRRYEALRAVFLDQLPLTEVAQQFGYGYGSLRNLVSQFRAQCRSGQLPPFFTTPTYGRPKGRILDHPVPQPEPQAIADRRQLALTPGRCLHTRVAGVFLFLPLLARLRFDDLVVHAGYPGSRMVPAPAALLSLLTLKLLDKERRSHITDFDFDEALGLFAGLNVLPKKSYAIDYSYRTTRSCQRALLSQWVAGLAPLLFPDAQEFALDFHPIPHRGDPEVLENHYLPTRGKAAPSILCFFAHEPQSRVLCYSNANLTRADQAGELMRFVEFWHDLTNHDPQWLYFDSKVVPYSELAKVNQHKIWFVTIRRRGAAILRHLNAVPASAWCRTVIDIPKRRHKNIRYLDERVKLRGYPDSLRQLAVAGLGRDEPTLCLSNNFQAKARELITRYVRRNGIEDALGISVNFFHLDCLASEVRLNVDLDVALTVIAHGCYRWLATRLFGYGKSKPKQVFQQCVATGGDVEIQSDRIVVRFEKRAHNPLLREAALDRECPPIPWLGGLRVAFHYP